MSETCIAQNLRFLRKQKKLSQERLAQELGMNRSNIASYENSLAEPSASRLYQLCRFFNVPMEDFIAKTLNSES